ncbi:hypothetical protein BDR07DRAFT_496419 [Suillus spraguei]|nr:hypothetical protein BDR07DRAFT_496419 [Suillus spraguei]
MLMNAISLLSSLATSRRLTIMEHANTSDSTLNIIPNPRYAQIPATPSVVDEGGDDGSVEEGELQTNREDLEGVLDEPGNEEPRLARLAWRTLPRSTRRIRRPRPTIEPNMIVPDESSPGLFGPRSPRNYEPHPDQPPPPEPSPAPMRQPVHSWVTWHRDKPCAGIYA